MHQILDVPLQCDCNLVSLPPFPCSLEEMKEYSLPTASTFNSVNAEKCVCVTGGGGRVLVVGISL